MIVVTGATGAIGRDLVRLLSAGGHEVRAVSRTVAGEPLAHVERVAADLADRDATTRVPHGADRLFLLTGNTDDMVRLQKNAIRAAVAAGVRVVVVEHARAEAASAEGRTHEQVVQKRVATAVLHAETELEGRSVAWTSENPTVATVDRTGRVTGRAPGTTHIVATSGGRSGRSPVIVHVPPRGTHVFRLDGIESWRVPYIDIGPTTWTDAGGVAHAAFRVATGGTLTLRPQAVGNPAREQTVRIATFLHGGGLAPPVAGGWIWVLD